MATGSRTRASHAAEVQRLQRWCSTVLGAIRDLAPDGGVHLAGFLKVVESCTTVVGLRQVSRDILEWANGLRPADRALIDERLRAAFGKGLDAGVANEAEALARVLRRGRIVGEHEFRLVTARVDEIYADERHREELKNLNAMLQAFEGR